MAELIARPSAIPLGVEPRLGNADSLSPTQLLVAIYRGWLLILVFGLVFSVAAYSYSKAYITPKFTAVGTVAVETSSFAIPELQGAYNGEIAADPMPKVRSEAQILDSRALVQSVVEELKLTADPEFNGTLRGPSLKVRIGGALRQVLPDFLATPLVESGILPPAQSTPPSPETIRDNVVAAVQHSIDIINDNRSLIIDVEFVSEQPDLSARVVNSLIAHYMAAKVAAGAAANREANVELRKRVNEVHGDVDRIERQIQQTRQKYSLVQISAGSVGQQQLQDLSSALIQASAARAQLEANFQRAAVLARSGGAGGDNSDALSSSIVGTLRDREATAERRVAQLQTTLGPGHPSRLAAEAELASARGAVISEAKRVMAGLGAQASAAKQREADLQSQLAKAEGSASTLASVQGELAQLEKDADASRSLYLTLLQRAEQTEANKDGPEQSGVRVVSAAVAPTDPSSPRPKLAGGLGLLSGFAFGGILSVAMRRLDRDYADATEVTADTGLAVMAVLPRIKGNNVSLATRVVTDPAGAEAETFRSLRTRLRLAGSGSPRSVLFVSSEPGEGTSSMAAAFARVAALDGLRVLLVEGDLQNPTLAKILDVATNMGLIETLSGYEHWPESIGRDNATPMDLLLVGAPQPAASQLLETMQLQSLMAEAREEYNLVVMDGHPLTQAMHSLTLANLVDVVVLVVGADGKTRKQVRAAVTAVSGLTRRPPVVALNKASA